MSGNRFFQSPVVSEEKLVKLMENENALIVCSDKFPYSEYLNPQDYQCKFISKINDATRVNKNNPISGAWRAMQSECLAGSDNIRSGRVNGEHRVQFIARHSTTLKKLIIYFVVDDRKHKKYNLKEINDSYASKKRTCGEDKDWDIIIDLINKNSFLKGAQLKLVEVQKEEKISIITQTKSIDKTENSPLEKDSDFVETLSEKLPETLPVTSQLAPVENKPNEKETPKIEPADLTTVAEETDTEATTENNTDTPAKKKKHKKKKKKTQAEEKQAASSNGSLQKLLDHLIESEGTEALAEKLDIIFSCTDHDTLLKIIRGLLNLGMNPDMVDAEGQSILMRFACSSEHIEITRLLLKWDTSLVTWSVNSNRFVEHLTVAIENRYHIQIIEALIKKTKEKNELDSRLSAVPSMNILHFATRFGHVPAVKLLLAEGADITAQSDNGFTPLEYAQKMFAKNEENRDHLDVVRSMRNDGSLESTLPKGTPMTKNEKADYNEIREMLTRAESLYVRSRSVHGSGRRMGKS